MLPASDLAEILTNLSALNLQPNTAAQILAAVLAPLLRNSGPDLDPDLEIRKKRAGRPRGRPRRVPRRRKKARARRRAGRSTQARERAIAALRANPDASSLTAVAKAAGVSKGTVVKRARSSPPRPAASRVRPPSRRHRKPTAGRGRSSSSRTSLRVARRRSPTSRRRPARPTSIRKHWTRRAPISASSPPAPIPAGRRPCSGACRAERRKSASGVKLGCTHKKSPSRVRFWANRTSSRHQGRVCRVGPGNFTPSPSQNRT